MILEKVDERRARMVEEIRMVPRPGAVGGMLKLLETVSPYVRSWKIEALRGLHIRQHWHPAHTRQVQTLDVRLLSAKLSLPSLTSFHAPRQSLAHVGTLALICNPAPNLYSIDVDLIGADASSSTWLKRFPRLSGPTKIRRLCIAFDAYLSEASTSRLLSFFRRITAVQHLSIPCPRPYPPNEHSLQERLIKIIRTYENLGDFHCSEQLGRRMYTSLNSDDEDGEDITEPRPDLAQVQRLTIQGAEWSDVVRPLYLPKNSADHEDGSVARCA